MTTAQVLEPAQHSGAIPGRDRPLKVALVNAADRGGGAEASTLSLHRALLSLGHESHVFVGTKLTDDDSVHEIRRFRCFPGVLRGARLLEEKLGWQYLYHPWFRRLDRLLPPGIDVVHFQTLWSGKLGYADVGALPRLSRLFPTLMTLRDLWMLTGHCGYPALGCERWKTGCGQCPDLALAPAIPRDGTRFNWNRKRRAMARSNIRVTTVSHWLADRVRECPIFAGKAIHAVHNGIDELHFHPRPRAEMRRKLGLPEDAFIVLLAGQSVEGTSHGRGAVDYALEALNSCGVNPFVLAIGRSAARFIERWSGKGLAVPFLNDPSALAEHYAASDVTLVASLWETFGRIPAEAQMCGIPVAGFATGGIPEIVVHHETGLIAERLNAPALGAALRTLCEQPELRWRMGTDGAKRAAAMFSNATIAQTFIGHYGEVVAERRAAKSGA
ncbi:MAG: glycosyltransferase [Planctomycetia bacterium]|nr:glycosyltransferase [Planctomycetia bacterium]